MVRKLTIVLMMVLTCAMCQASLRLPQLFQDGMVLQRGVDIPVWGWADAGAQITVSLTNSKGRIVTAATATAGADGSWMLRLPYNKKVKAGGPYSMMVTPLTDSTTEGAAAAGSQTEVITDVLVGDVWLCSGQSNMETTVERVYPQYPADIDSYENKRIRLFHVQYNANAHGEQPDVKPTTWQPVTKESAWRFSAIGYFLGQRMAATTGVPQGVIETAWGGTPIEAWVSADSLRRDFPMMVRQTEFYRDDDMIAAQQRANQKAQNHWQQMLDAADPGVGGRWTTADYDDSAWRTVNQYEPLLGQGRRSFTGSLWLRQHVTVDHNHAGRPAQLLLGTLFDCDYTYVNGREVGRTYYEYPPRRYQIPAGVLREGDNVITIRFINKYGVPHFIKEKPYRIVFSDSYGDVRTTDCIPLGEQWLIREGAEMPQCPGGNMPSLQNLPSTLYNGMLRPLAPFAVAGCVWYQGESNTGNAAAYAVMLRKLMAGWREAFRQPQMPFVICQLANYMAPSELPQNSGWSQLREAQRTVAASDPRAELAVAIDLGETVDIHPLRKRELTERIALCFDRMVYGRDVRLSPQVVSTTVSGRDIRLTTDQDLQPADRLKYFEVAGRDGRYHNAEARTDGKRTIVITSPVDNPASVRYAWRDNPIGVNVYSTDSMPLPPQQLDL